VVQLNIKHSESLKPFVFLSGAFTLFIFLISFAIFYTTENFSSICGCQTPLWLIIVSISSLGLFTGILTYHILSNNFIKEKKELKGNLLKILDVLDSEDRAVLKTLIKNNGEMNQSALAKSTGLDKVKMSRVISKMEQNLIIRKERNGMTNKIILSKEISILFLENDGFN
jgi:hypothetical protein